MNIQNVPFTITDWGIIKPVELIALFKNTYEIRLRRFDGNTFATDSNIWNYNHLKISFNVSEKGKVNKTTIPLEQCVDDIVFTRVINPSN